MIPAFIENLFAEAARGALLRARDVRRGGTNVPLARGTGRIVRSRPKGRDAA
jgi:hypothetical protein